MDQPEDTLLPSPATPAATAREARLAAALRANLHRRKAQGRARAAMLDRPATPDTPPTDRSHVEPAIDC
jgi:hypothetical protein